MPPSGLVSEHEQICGHKLRMRYRMSVIYGHPVIAATRALRFADHVTKRNGGSGDENAWRPGLSLYNSTGSCFYSDNFEANFHHASKKGFELLPFMYVHLN